MPDAPRERHVTASAHIDIGASPDVVFRWATEPDRVVKWVRDLVESRPLDDAGLRVGARSIEVIRAGGKLQDVQSQVTALEPGRLIELRMDMPDGSTTSRVVITPATAGSTVTQTMNAGFTGMRLVPAWLVSALVRQRLRGDLRRLKERVEGG